MAYYNTMTCRTCGDEYPATAEFFTQRRDYLDNECHRCAALLNGQRKAHILRMNIVPGQQLAFMPISEITEETDLLVPVATMTCRVCHRSYAPFRLFWADCDLCIYCQEDGAK